ncbi:MAG: protein translocase subunit SecD [Butyrivibrio sp.]
MKTWQKMLSILVLLAMLGLTGFTVLSGWGSGHKGSARNINLGLDLRGGVSITYRAIGDVSSQDMSDTQYKMSQRVAQYDGAQVYTEGSDRVTIEIPGADDAEEILNELGKPGAVYFILQYGSDGETANYSGNSLYGYKLERTLEEIEADGTIILTGSDIKDCQGVYQTGDNNEKQPVVSFVLTDEGATKFADATRKAYENGWTLGVYYDGEFISVPAVNNGAITGGSGIIEGMSSLDEAKQIASYIRIGALPIQLEEISSQVVGATLGQEAIKSSVIAGIIGFALVFIFMIVVYRVPGVAADIALFVYAGAMLLILNVFDLTLTLPGIAGIVLSVGMAVDGNVVIFARIKEELSTGVGVGTAIRTGFRKALSAIIDGNVTTLIAAIVLGIIGTGPVRGFALTLGIGIVLSMITSLLITRWILVLFYSCGCKSEKLYGVAKSHKTINFLKHRKIFISISALIVATGVAFMVVNGVNGKGVFNFDLEFSGGTSTSVTFDKEYTLDEVEKEIIPVIKEATGSKTVQQQIVKGSNTIVFKTQMLDHEKRAALNKALADKFGIDTSNKEVVNSENISATVSSEMRRDAVIAVIVATLCMLIYIWIRFRDVKFATSAILALVHDVLVVLAFYAVSRTNVGNTFIACMLTIVGYSINATIVIFDRVRENMAVMKKSTLSEVVNSSITSTLSRSINTSLTTFFMVFMLFVLGVSSIREFAAPIMVGILAGAYSSMFISGALWFMMKKASYKKAVKKAN